MDRAWSIEEIRLLIFDYLTPGDLARFARTNRASFHITVGHLWKALGSLRPFICCLPPYWATQELTLDDVTRLDFYAQQVRTIYLEGNTPNDVLSLPRPFPAFRRRPTPTYQGRSWTDVWTNIANVRPATTFLPNLRILGADMVVEELLLPLVGISGSRLSHIRIRNLQSRQGYGITKMFLQQLCQTPVLEFLYIHYNEIDLVPTRLIAQSPLQNLHLEPRVPSQEIQKEEGEQKSRVATLVSEVLRKSTLEHLKIALTRGWFGIEVGKLKSYLPSLKSLRLDLRGFKAVECDEQCINNQPGSWTCIPRASTPTVSDPSRPFDCGHRSPMTFIQGLDRPELEVVHITFTYLVDRTMLLDMVTAVVKYTRIDRLQELHLDIGDWVGHCDECGERPPPNLRPQDVKDALALLLPLPRLQILRLPLVPNLLTEVDLEFSDFIARGLSSLQTLDVGSNIFATTSASGETRVYERMSLQSVAAFCQLQPNLTKIELGCVDALALDEIPSPELTCPIIKKLIVLRWVNFDEERRRDVCISRDLLQRNLQAYFPNSNLARYGLNPKFLMFNQSWHDFLNE